MQRWPTKSPAGSGTWPNPNADGISNGPMELSACYFGQDLAMLDPWPRALSVGIMAWPKILIGKDFVRRALKLHQCRVDAKAYWAGRLPRPKRGPSAPRWKLRVPAGL